MSSPLILLPPSEGKASGGNGPAWSRVSMALDLDDRRVEVIGALAKAMLGTEAARAKLLGVKARALSAATAADRDVLASPTMPAIERYTGVLYDALDHGSLTATQRGRLDRSVVVISGLWGAVTPADPIPDYKLKMGASLPGLGKLSTWWRDDLSARLAGRATGMVWNLLPNEHAAAWLAPESLHQWSVRFMDRRPDGSMVAVSHRNKSLKGKLVRYLLAHPTADPGELADWQDPSGYRLDASLTREGSTLSTISFVAP